MNINSKNQLIKGKTTKTVRLSDEDVNFLLTHFGKVTTGINTCIDIVKEITKQDANIDFLGLKNIVNLLQRVRSRSLQELQGRFTSNEWIFLTDVLNGTITDSSYRFFPEVLIASCEDAQLFENKATFHSVDLSVITEKIQKLTSAQIEALYYRIEQFWENSNRLDLATWATF